MTYSTTASNILKKRQRDSDFVNYAEFTVHPLVAGKHQRSRIQQCNTNNTINE